MPVSGDLHIGDSLLGYEIEALIGRGGMGVVYRARDRALDRKVALKLIAPELAAFTGFRARFLAESRLAASLEHPNVVPIYAAGEQDDLLYIAMRYVEGSDLKRILMDGPLPPDRTIAICSQVASALDAAHELGLVHRDVKPSNVLVDPHDHAFLVDFGLTRLVSDIGQVPVATSSLGTIEYIAPEQIRGDRIDGRTDVYSLGCVLHECITGEPPFPHASEVALLFAHLEEEPPATSSLGDVLAKALAKDPDDRYATCGELVDAAATALGVAHQRKRRWPVIAAVLAAAVIALSAGIAVMTRGAERGDHRPALPDQPGNAPGNSRDPDWRSSHRSRGGRRQGVDDRVRRHIEGRSIQRQDHEDRRLRRPNRHRRDSHDRLRR